MAEPFIGQVTLFAGNFAPRGWAFCSGQLLAISQNQALFSILGTFYGGDGRTTFALPDLRGRVPVHPGQGPGLANRTLGERGGAEQVSLSTDQIPAHAHNFRATTNAADSTTPAGKILASGPTAYGSGANTQLSNNVIRNTGGGSPHDNMQPWLGLNYIIAITGIYPSRN